MILSRPVQKIVRQAIFQSQSCNRYVLCETIAAILETKYRGDKLNYQSTRMHLGTTKQILEVIDSYFYGYLPMPSLSSAEVSYQEKTEETIDVLDFLDIEDL